MRVARRGENCRRRKVNYNFGGVRIFFCSGTIKTLLRPWGGFLPPQTPLTRERAPRSLPWIPLCGGGFLVREGLRSPPYNPPAATMPLHAFFFLYCLLSLVIAPSLLARHFLVSEFIHMSIFRTHAMMATLLAFPSPFNFS